jgi:hypothetical protein
MEPNSTKLLHFYSGSSTLVIAIYQPTNTSPQVFDTLYRYIVQKPLY